MPEEIRRLSEQCLTPEELFEPDTQTLDIWRNSKFVIHVRISFQGWRQDLLKTAVVCRVTMFYKFPYSERKYATACEQ